MVVGAVHHVGGVNKLIAGTRGDQLGFRVAQHQFAPDKNKQCGFHGNTIPKLKVGNNKKTKTTRWSTMLRCHWRLNEIVCPGGAGCDASGPVYLVSTAMGAKSIRCLVWKMRVLVRISMTGGGCRGVATANRASRGFPSGPPSSRRYFRWPENFKACRRGKVVPT